MLRGSFFYLGMGFQIGGIDVEYDVVLFFFFGCVRLDSVVGGRLVVDEDVRVAADRFRTRT